MLALLCSLALSPQFTDGGVLAPPSEDPSELTFADLDGDGLDDLAVIVESEPAIATWLRAGPDSFTPSARLEVPGDYQPAQLLTGDVDGDGDVDLVVFLSTVVGGSGTDAVGVALGDGTGSFGSLTVRGASPGGNFIVEDPGRIAVGDLDGDGIDEILLSLREPFFSGRVDVVDPFGGPATSLPLPPGFIGFLLLEDLDLDGNVDLAYARSGAVGWARGDGNGGFMPVFEQSVALNVNAPGMALSDESEDGLPELVAWWEGSVVDPNWVFDPFDPAPPTVPAIRRVVFPGTATGPTAAGFVEESYPFALTLESLDLDRDGRRDVLLATNEPLVGFAWRARLTAGGGALGPLGFFPGQIGGVTDLETGDTDGDGLQDLVAARGTGDIDTLELAAPGAVPAATLRGQLVSGTARVVGLDVLDLDGDGLMDVVSRSEAPTDLTWARGTAPGTFAPVQPIGDGPLVTSSFEPSGAWSDIDGDGDLDRVFAEAVTSVVRWLEQTSGGAFERRTLVDLAPDLFQRVLVDDLDGDGRDDVLAINESAGLLFPCLADGAGGFTRLPTVAVDLDVTVGLVDANGDGSPDLLSQRRVVLPDPVGARELLELSVGDGAGGFLAPVELASLPPIVTSRGMIASERRDLDGDGLGDLLVAGQGGDSEVYLLPGAPGGTFAAPQSIASFEGRYRDLEFGDIDGDGALDFAFTTLTFGNPGVVYWVKGRGDGTFELPQRIATLEGGLVALGTGDLDADGDLDLALASYFSGEARWVRTLARGDVGEAYCDAVPNSTGEVGTLRGRGSAVVGDGALVLEAGSLPAATFGLFVTGTAPTSTPIANSVGRLCVGGDLARFVGPGQIMQSSPAGELALQVDLRALPSGNTTVSATAGDVRYFQLWHRDVGPAGPTSNLTRALRVVVF